MQAKSLRYEKTGKDIDLAVIQINLMKDKKQQTKADLIEKRDDLKTKFDTVKREVRRLREEMKLDYDRIEEIMDQLILVKKAQREEEERKRREEEEKKRREEEERKRLEEEERQRVLEE